MVEWDSHPHEDSTPSMVGLRKFLLYFGLLVSTVVADAEWRCFGGGGSHSESSTYSTFRDFVTEFCYRKFWSKVICSNDLEVQNCSAVDNLAIVSDNLQDIFWFWRLFPICKKFCFGAFFATTISHPKTRAGSSTTTSSRAINFRVLFQF